VLNGLQQESAEFTLGPNERTLLGLYVVPPTLPAPGTNFVMNVEVTDGVNTEMDTIPWMMPGQAHNLLEVTPEKVYLEIGGSADFDLTMENVGNTAGSFPYQLQRP
jgi:hypothetical protein